MTKFFYIFFFIIIQGCSHFGSVMSSPKVELSEVGFKKISPTDITLDVTLAVENPNAVSLTLQDLKYVLEVDQQKVVSEEVPEKITIGSHQTVPVHLPIRLKYTDLISSALKLLSKKGTPYRVVGSTRVGPFTIPFEKTGSFNLSDL